MKKECFLSGISAGEFERKYPFFREYSGWYFLHKMKTIEEKVNSEKGMYQLYQQGQSICIFQNPYHQYFDWFCWNNYIKVRYLNQPRPIKTVQIFAANKMPLFETIMCKQAIMANPTFNCITFLYFTIAKTQPRCIVLCL